MPLSPKKLRCKSADKSSSSPALPTACTSDASLDSDNMLAVTMNAKNHLGKLAENLQRMRENDNLCDFTLKAESLQISVHKVIMAASSDYFLSMLTSNMRESRESEVELKGITSNALQVIVDFIYTGVLKLNMENVQEVLTGATHLQVQNAVQLCSKYIESSITSSNCVDVMNLADIYSLTSAYNMARKYILEHFEKVAESNQYTLLTAMQLGKMLEENSLKIVSEYKLFELVLKWINLDLPERERHLYDLMKHVRLPLLSGEELVDKVSRVELVKNNMKCLQLLTEAKDYHILINKQPLYQSPCTQVRSNLTGFVMCFGKCLESYFINEEHRHRLYMMKDPPAHLYNPCLVVVDNFMYACGGKYEGHAGNDIATAMCFRYDPRFDTWFEIASLLEPRRDFCLVALKGHLYAIGGQDENKVMATQECYSIVRNEWTNRSSIYEQLYGHAGAVCGEKIYVTGGNAFSYTSKKLHSYTPDNDQWVELSSMSYPRVHHIMECVNDKLYVLGGSSNGGIIFPTFTPYIECYDPKFDQWTTCKQTLNVVNAGSAVYENLIYIAGGALNDGIISFDPDKGEISSLDIYRYTTILTGKACCIMTLPHF